MKTQTNKLPMSDFLALFFSRKVDNNLLIYSIIKDLNIYVRYFIYIVMPAILFVGLFFGSKFFLELNPFQLSSEAIFLLEYLMMAIIYVTYILAVLVIFYEPFFRDQRDLKELKDFENLKSDLRKEKKMQWWRLRNMTVWTRIIVYILFLFVTAPLYYISIFLTISFITLIVVNEIKIKKRIKELII
ncbi:MAG: hypothetical protein WA945_10250 [Arcobacteraceae bacterium]